MAKSYYSLGRSLSRAEAIAGWCYLPFYLVLLSAGIQYLAAALHVSLTALTINIIYFSVNLLFVLLVFRNFLLQRFFGSGFWNFVQSLILGFALTTRAHGPCRRSSIFWPDRLPFIITRR